MKYTKKIYEMVGKTLVQGTINYANDEGPTVYKGTPEERYLLSYLIAAFIEVFKKDNPNFNEERFLKYLDELREKLVQKN